MPRDETPTLTASKDETVKTVSEGLDGVCWLSACVEE